MRLTFVH